VHNSGTYWSHYTGMRTFPRFTRNPLPECSPHGRTMRLVPCPRPKWLLVSLSESTDGLVWRCTQTGWRSQRYAPW